MPQMVPLQKNLFELANVITEDELGIPSSLVSGDISSFISAFIQKFPRSSYCFLFKREGRQYRITLSNNEIDLSFYSGKEKSNKIHFRNSRIKNIYVEGFEEVIFENSNANEISVKDVSTYLFVNGTYNNSKIFDCENVRLISAYERSLETTIIDRCALVQIISSVFNNLKVTNSDSVNIYSANTTTSYFSGIRELYLYSISSSDTIIQNVTKFYFYASELLNANISSVSEAYFYRKVEGQIQDTVATFYNLSLENTLIKNSIVNLSGVFNVKNSQIINSEIYINGNISFENTKILSSTMKGRLLLFFNNENFIVNTKFLDDIRSLSYNNSLFIDDLSFYSDTQKYQFYKLPFVPETVTSSDGEKTVLEFVPKLSGTVGINITEITLQGAATVNIYENNTLIKTISVTSNDDIHDSINVQKNKKIKITCLATNSITAKFFINYNYECITINS